MDLTKDFLQKDLHKAVKHTICIGNLEFRYQQALEEGDYTKARQRAEELVRSLKELEQLQRDKKEYERFVRLIGILKESGIKAENIQRLSI